MTAVIIADAIFRVLQQTVNVVALGQDGRAFFRVDGFDDAVYQELCDRLRTLGDKLGRFQAIVRTVELLGPGYEAYSLEPGRTATYWRNHVPDGYALILIFNHATSDGQSLANLFVINESLVGRKYLDILIGATFGSSLLSATDSQMLRSFIQLFYGIREPQLQSLVRFLASVKAAVVNRNVDMHTAIATALPELKLFRSTKVAALLAGGGYSIKTGPLVALLRRINSAANHELQSIESKDVDRHMKRLDTITFEDEPQFSATAKRTAVVNYLRGLEMTQALHIDWSEIELMLSNRSGRKRKKADHREQLKELGAHIKETLEKKRQYEQLDDEQSSVVEQLLEGNNPDLDAAERLFESLGRQLGSKLCREATQALGIGKPLVTDDFPLGITQQALKLLGRFDPVPEDIQLQVRLVRSGSPSAQARMAFQLLYGKLPALLNSLTWDVGPILTSVAPDEIEAADADPASDVTVEFEVLAITAGEIVGREQLDWEYTDHSPAADLVDAVRSLRGTVSAGRVQIPIFIVPRHNEAPDVGRLSQSLGPWWKAGSLNLRVEWINGAERRRGLDSEAAKEIMTAIEELEEAFASLLEGAPQGILDQIEPFLKAYDTLLTTMGKVLTTDQEVSLASDLVNRAWTICDPDHNWLAVPLLHPLKLVWYLNRVRYFNMIVSRLLAPGPLAVVDMPWLQRDIKQRFSSAYFPAVMVYGSEDGKKQVFLPADEAGGTELYRPATTAKGYVGSVAKPADEDRASLANAAIQVKRSIDAYLEAYPFAGSGLNILLANVQSAALPIAVLNTLKSSVDVTLTVHCHSNVASVFSAVNDWVVENAHHNVRAENSYFPRVRVRVAEQKLDEVISERRFDVVILVDALAEAGQEISFRTGSQQPDQPLADFVPFFQPIPDPFAHGASRREVALTRREMPSVIRRFYSSQAASMAPHERPLATEQPALFSRILQIGGWQKVLRLLHERAVWVVCYDINADRFLLEQTADKEHLHIIRYVQGLGPKKLHNLTVSSSYRAREEVVRRVTQRLQDLLSGYQPQYRQALALALVNRAQQMSGSIILQAAGPGTKLNELLGLVMTKRAVEGTLRAEWPGCLVAWVYLDDYREWFGPSGKRPDMLAVAARLDADERLELTLCVAEAKLVSDISVEAEQEDALRQVRRGVGILGRAFEPGKPFVDSEYWYDQLYQAIVANLEFKVEDEKVVEALTLIRTGDYKWSLRGDAWVFSYDRPSTGTSEVEEVTAGEALYAHAVNQRGVRRVLDGLLREAVGDRPDLPNVDADPAPCPSTELETTEQKDEDKPAALVPGALGHRDREIAPAALEEGAAPAEREVGAAPAEQEIGVAPFEREMETAPPERTPDGGHGPDSLSASSTPTAGTVALLADYDTRGDEAEAMQYAQACMDQTVRFLRSFDQRVTPAGILVGPRVVRLRLAITISKTSNFKQVSGKTTDLRMLLKLGTMPLIQVGDDGNIWIDIPRPRPATVGLKPLIANLGRPKLLPETRFPLGVTMDNSPFIADLRKVPHWLVGGTSGSGKSVFLRAVLLSLMLTNTPDMVQFVIIDPKGDLVAFRHSPYVQQYVHSRTGLAQAAVETLQGVKRQMDQRLELMVDKHMVNEIDDYHRVEGRISLARIVVLIEEYGDLASDDEYSKELAGVVQQIAAIGRAPGFHLFVCTQNPVVKTVSTDIKANCSGRVALWVKTGTNSLVILDETGAEDLLKNGDMLFKSDGPTVRIQAPYVDNLRELQPILKQMAELYPGPREEG